MTKKIASIMAAAVLVLGLSACGASYETVEPGEESTPVQSTGDLQAREVTLPSGDTVICVYYDRIYRGGLTCDWEGTPSE